MLNLDLWIAAGLVAVVIVVLITTKVGKLPKKSLSFIIGGVAGMIGLAVFRQKQLSDLEKELRDREKRLKEREKKLQELKEKYGASEEELEKVRNELQKQRSAYEAAMLKIQETSKKEKERIDQLSGEDLHNEFLNSFGGQT